MSFPTVLRATLLANDPVLALVSTRIYWKKLPQEPTYPALTLELLNGDPQNTLASLPDLKWARVRVNAWNITYGTAFVVALAVETALNGQQFSTIKSVVAQGLRDMYEPAVEAYYVTQDFSIWHTE